MLAVRIDWTKMVLDAGAANAIVYETLTPYNKSLIPYERSV